MQNPNQNEIKLSKITEQLLQALRDVKRKQPTDEYSKITVSQTASFIALVYEKVRNAIEYREDHLIRRAAIERILNRRISLNPKGKNEAENIIRELLWSRYFPNGTLDEYDVNNIQAIIDSYVEVKRKLLTGRRRDKKQYISEFLLELYTSEIEENLNPVESQVEADFTYYIYQTLKNKVKIEDVTQEEKELFLFVAIENVYRKSDRAYQRYHIFQLFYKPLSKYSVKKHADFMAKLPDIFERIDTTITNPSVTKLEKFVRSQLPPYLILFDLIRQKEDQSEQVLANASSLWTTVEQIAREKYAFIKDRLNTLAFRSLIYIFVTKMLLALILEVPVSQLLYNEVSFTAIGINTLAPPIFMLLIILTVSLPGENNTKRLYHRIVDIIDKDSSFEETVAYMTKKTAYKKTSLKVGFTILYLSTFFITIMLIHVVLSAIGFHLLSEALFIFFISVVAFFAYRIKQLANRYKLVDKVSVFQPVTDFFFMPILSMGKFFSEGISKINIFIILFDFIIEAPYKLIVEVVEEWISFVRQKKEEIV